MRRLVMGYNNRFATQYTSKHTTDEEFQVYDGTDKQCIVNIDLDNR